MLARADKPTEWPGASGPLGTSRKEFRRKLQALEGSEGYGRYERRAQSAKWLQARKIEAPKEGLARTIAGSITKRKVVPLPEGHPKFGLWGTPEGEEFTGLIPRAQVWVRPDRQARCSWRFSDVFIHAKGENAHFSGIEKCGSVWACPVCAATIRRGRSLEIQQAVEKHLEEVPGGLLFMTLTARHRKNQRLADTLDAVLGGATRLLQGERWAGESENAYNRRIQKYEARLARYKAEKDTNRRLREPKEPAPQRMGLREKYGILGTIRSTEVTAGHKFGWHPHNHLLIFTKKKLSDQEIREFEGAIFELWKQVLKEKTGLVPERKHGVKTERVDSGGKVLAKYLAKTQDQGKKWGVGDEIARGDVKKGRTENFSPYQLLDKNFPLSEGKRATLWLEFVDATKGRKAFAWSHGLKKHFAVEELSDAEILEAQESEPQVYKVEGQNYDRVRLHEPGTLFVALEFARKGQWKNVQRVLPGHKIE